jgi:DNA-binding XRE family transcriptional regulator
MKDITYFARTNFRRGGRLFGIRRADRLSHMYAIGKTGVGKSTLFETLMRQDLDNGEGFALLDPHGDLFEKVKGALLTTQREAVIPWDVPDLSSSMRFNPLASVPAEKRSLAVAGLISAFERQWHDSWGVRMEHVLRKARKAARLTQVDVALALGRTQSFVSKIERGEIRLDPIELQRLAELYRVEVTALLPPRKE